jgi:hypothetical protein
MILSKGRIWNVEFRMQNIPFDDFARSSGRGEAGQKDGKREKEEIHQSK